MCSGILFDQQGPCTGDALLRKVKILSLKYRLYIYFEKYCITNIDQAAPKKIIFLRKS